MEKSDWSFKDEIEKKKLYEKIGKSPRALIAKQQEDHDIMFMPENGICWSCQRGIMGSDAVIKTIISGGLVTGCPYCNRSYVS